MNQNDTPERRASIRPRAIADIERCADYLEANATPEVASRFRSAIMQAVEQIEALPGAGSPRQIKNPRLAGLRMWIVPGFQTICFSTLRRKEEQRSFACSMVRKM